MRDLILRIFDFFSRRPVVGWSVFLLLTLLAGVSVSSLTLSEDISDFLPQDQDNQAALKIYQSVSGSSRVYAIASMAPELDVDEDALAGAIEDFAVRVEELKGEGIVSKVTYSIDLEEFTQIASFVYANAPLFLSEEDCERIDSKLSEEGCIGELLAQSKRSLMMPSASLASGGIALDPLGLFSPLLWRLQSGEGGMDYDTYDGCIMTPDGAHALAMIESPFGSSESGKNSLLSKRLQECAALTSEAYPSVNIILTGGPVIAAANAQCIKKDSILIGFLAFGAILLLLLAVFRNAGNILLIFSSVLWGYLIAMGLLALRGGTVSVIIIGIATVIVGIALNYPLHLIDHIRERGERRGALGEIITPLVVGNVTTVGAFLCLVPLGSPALHDLGLFSSLLLVGTILFVILFLPHAVRLPRKTFSQPRFLSALSGWEPQSPRAMVWVIVALTMVLGLFSLRTGFDTDLRNIGYMTSGQKEGLGLLQPLLREAPQMTDLYLVSTGEGVQSALEEHERLCEVLAQSDSLGLSMGPFSAFIRSEKAQAFSIGRWQALVEKHRKSLTDELDAQALAQGFTSEAFAPFRDLVDRQWRPLSPEGLSPLVSTLFSSNIIEDPSSGLCSVVEKVSVRPLQVEAVKALCSGASFCFDVQSMNRGLSQTLSGNFNYIGFVCGCIVFFFLWLSFGSFWLALVAFVPMAVSWLWILGLMALLGIKFNIVNIILATFIFGQGDDYTIFITEGLIYEKRTGRKVLSSYKGSILVSALIMFIGIGTLIFARHPAMRSLGEVTLIGMACVVFMAYLIPPILFRALDRLGLLKLGPTVKPCDDTKKAD